METNMSGLLWCHTCVVQALLDSANHSLTMQLHGYSLVGCKSRNCGANSNTGQDNVQSITNATPGQCKRGTASGSEHILV